jgi:transposase
VDAPGGKEKSRLSPFPIQQQVQAHLTWLENALETIKAALTTTMRQSPVWREQEEGLRSGPGVGPVLTTTLFANLPDLPAGRQGLGTP